MSPNYRAGKHGLLISHALSYHDFTEPTPQILSSKVSISASFPYNIMFSYVFKVISHDIPMISHELDFNDPAFLVQIAMW